MPALGEYHSQFRADMITARRCARMLRRSATAFDVAMTNLINNYTYRDHLPEYFYDLYQQFRETL